MTHAPSLPDELQHWLGPGDSASDSLQSVPGGSICRSFLLRRGDGSRLFIKLHDDPPADLFASEAASLHALDAAGAGLRIPLPLFVCRTALVLPFIDACAPPPRYWQTLGEGLARLHRQTAPAFGLDRPTYCGLTRQDNTPCADGHEFFRERRLLHLATRCNVVGLLPTADRHDLERLAARLPRLIPAQPASLLHGDLWFGNQFAAADGVPVLVDPATCHGWREADLAMTTLFGHFPADFYDAYAQSWPLEPGWRERLPLYNLYHLLNHLLLFGASYLSSVQRILFSFR